MNFRHLLLAALACAALLSFACGDGPDKGSSTPTVRPGETRTPADPSGFGPAPTLGGNIVQVSPAHAAKVARASTITTNQLQPRGVCAKVTFDGLPNYGQSFRFIVDETDVTAAGETVWIVATNTAPKDGTLCFAPKAGLSVGMHTAAIGVQDPNNLNAPFKQTVAWKFEVTE